MILKMTNMRQGVMADSAISTALLAVIYISWAASTSETALEYSTWMNDNHNYKLHWKIDQDEKSIRFAAEVQTTGWIGFGISKDLSGKMANADLVVGWINSAGKCFLKDGHGIGVSRPPLDNFQDYYVTGCSQTNSWTTISFVRYLDTCDRDDMTIVNGIMAILYAWGSSNPEGDMYSNTRYHGRRNKGSKLLTLMNYTLKLNHSSSANVSLLNTTQKNATATGNQSNIKILQPQTSCHNSTQIYEINWGKGAGINLLPILWLTMLLLKLSLLMQ